MTSNLPADMEFFECTQCGECCKGYGGTFVSPQEMANIAEYIGISLQDFRERYCVLSGKKPVLGQGSDGYCIFFNRNCTIHPVKPRMCRRWPFIDSLRVDINNWFIMADSCPGMNRGISPEDLIRKLHARMEFKP